MTLDDYLGKGGQVFERARRLEGHIRDLASAARSVGLEADAVSLERIASRALPMAGFFVMQLKER